MANEEELQKAVEAEMIRQQLLEIENQLNVLETKKYELQLIKESIDEVKGKKGNEILVPIGAGVLLRAEIKDDEKVLVNVGSNVVVERNLEETKKIIDNQISEVEKAEQILQEELKKYV